MKIIKRLVLVLIIIFLMCVTAGSVLSAVTELETESFSITAELDFERALTLTQKEQINKFVDLSSSEKAQINATVSLTSETDWNISGDFLGLRIIDRIVLSGNYEKAKLDDGSIIFYGYFIDEQVPGGMYMYYIPSQDKLLITYNIHTDNEQAIFTFGSSFKEIEEVVTFEEWQRDPSVDSLVQLDNIIRSGMSWRASAETQYIDRYVAYLWHAGETGSPNRMHLTQVHVVSNKNSFKDAWNEHARPGYVLDKPRVIRTWNRVSMDPYYHRINHAPVNGSRNFTIPIYIPYYGIYEVTFTTSTTSATLYTHSGTGYVNRIYWELYKSDGFTDKEVDYSAYLNKSGEKNWYFRR